MKVPEGPTAPHLYTIPPSAPFLTTLARALLSGDLPLPGGAKPDPLTLPLTTIYLPTRRGERQVVPFAFAGVSLCEAKLFDGAPDGPFSLNLLWDQALAKGRLYGVRLDGRWMHVGTPEALAEAEASFEHEGA